MVTTSPISNEPKHQVAGSPRPANHKKLITFIVILVIIGALAVLYAAYNSHRNKGEKPADNVGQTQPAASQTATANGVTNTQQSGASTVTTVKPQANQEITLKLYANSGDTLVNTVQAVIKYPQASLQLESVDGTGSAFPNEVATDKNTAGVIRLARAVASQTQSVKGEQVVATLKFKAVGGSTSSQQITVDSSQSLLVSSDDNRNLLQSDDGTLVLK